MKRGNVRGDRLMNECLCMPRRGKCQFTTPSKCFELKRCLERGWGHRAGGGDIQSSPLFHTVFESLLRQHKLTKLFKSHTVVFICTLKKKARRFAHSHNITATRFCISVTLDYNLTTGAEQQCTVYCKLLKATAALTSLRLCRSLCYVLHTQLLLLVPHLWATESSCELNTDTSSSRSNFPKLVHFKEELCEICPLIKQLQCNCAASVTCYGESGDCLTSTLGLLAENQPSQIRAPNLVCQISSCQKHGLLYGATTQTHPIICSLLLYCTVTLLTSVDMAPWIAFYWHR